MVDPSQVNFIGVTIYNMFGWWILLPFVVLWEIVFWALEPDISDWMEAKLTSLLITAIGLSIILLLIQIVMFMGWYSLWVFAVILFFLMNYVIIKIREGKHGRKEYK